MEGAAFCFFHNPASKSARRGAQRRGGQANRGPVLPANAEDLALTSAKDVTTLLAKTINQVRKGSISTKVATAIGYLAVPLMRAFEVSSYELFHAWSKHWQDGRPQQTACLIRMPKLTLRKNEPPADR